MKPVRFGLLLVGFMITVATADDPKRDVIKKDQQQIQGTWRIIELVVNGNPAKEQDARKLTVINGSDGTWSLRSDSKEISKGISKVNPSEKPKTIDFTPTVGDTKDKLHLAIYKLSNNSRSLCFAPPGKDRPTKFRSEPGSGHILVKFERVKSP